MTASPGAHRGAVDDRVEGDGAEAGAGDVDAADHLAELGELAAGDLDPGQLGAAGQADADLLADLRVGAGRSRCSRASPAARRRRRSRR